MWFSDIKMPTFMFLVLSHTFVRRYDETYAWFTDFRLSRWLNADDTSILSLLHCADVGNVAKLWRYTMPSPSGSKVFNLNEFCTPVAYTCENNTVEFDLVWTASNRCAGYYRSDPPGYSDPAPDRKTDLPDTCPCTPIPRVCLFPNFYQAGEGMNSMCSVKSYPALPGYLFIPRSIVAIDISVVTEPLPSSLLVSADESCTRCLATVRLEYTYFLRYFVPLGRMPHFSLLILFHILIQ
jgi:hypothetical protein